MPELAAAYAAGFIANLLLLSGLLARLYFKKSTDDETSLQSHLILGIFCAFLSWPGFFFFTLIEGSLALIARRAKAKESDPTNSASTS